MAYTTNEKPTDVKENRDKNSKAKETAKIIPDELAFFICVGGIYISYCIFSYLQEEISRLEFGPEKKKFKNTAFLVFIQCIGNIICGIAAVQMFSNPSQTKAPFREYALIAASYVGAMWASNAAIQFVSYPFMVLAKSCKPIPVMLMGLIVFGKKQTTTKYICVFLVTVGIIIFSGDEISQSKKKNVETSYEGFALLVFSLILDSVTGPFQDRMVSKHRPSAQTMLLNTNIWASIYLGISLLYTGAGFQGVQFFMEHSEILPHIILYAISSAIGQNFIYYTITRFGSLMCSLITTTRKFFTILISVMIFGPMLTTTQWVGVAIVFAGLGVDIYVSSSKKKVE